MHIVLDADLDSDIHVRMIVELVFVQRHELLNKNNNDILEQMRSVTSIIIASSMAMFMILR